MEKINQDKFKSIEKQKRDYSLKREKLLKRMQDKNSNEVAECMRSMTEIEEKLQSRRLKHGLIMNEVIEDARIKNQIWEERALKMKEDAERRDREEQALLARKM